MDNELADKNPHWDKFLLHPWYPEDVLFELEKNSISYAPKDDEFFLVLINIINFFN